MKDSVRLRAFAKINLGLKILGRRPDGYHEIRTVYQTVSLHDRVEVVLRRRGHGVVVDCDDPGVPSGRRNLVHQACELWRRARGFSGGIQVHVEKRIPPGSGLGGGSSDAAATLLGLERLSGDRMDYAARWKLAVRLGSDVPLFLLGGRVLGCGRGEEVYPLCDLPRRHGLVVFPGFGVSTAEAYRAASGRTAASLRLTKQRPGSSISCFGAWSRFSLEDWGSAENDFEQSVFAKWPELAFLKRQLIRAGAEVASLTGSGSAVYAVFGSIRKLVRASKIVPAGWQTFRVRTLSRSEYGRLLFA